MGFNTAMVVLNDHLSAIENDPHFGRRVSEAVRDVYGRRQPNWDTSFTVLPSEHADFDQLVVVGGNSIRRMTDLPQAEAENLLRDLAWQLGFTLRRKPSLNVAPSPVSGNGG
jgi:hypothetical protein